jgi:hypothetical protein
LPQQSRKLLVLWNMLGFRHSLTMPPPAFDTGCVSEYKCSAAIG